MTPAPAPMLATPGELPSDEDGWVFEFKWDGMRCVAHRREAELALVSRTGRDVSDLYPELSGLDQALPADSILDGEIVALNQNGRPDFGLLQQRMNLKPASVTTEVISNVPVNLFVFDLIRYDGIDLTGLEWAKRREVLEQLELDGPAWRVPPVFRSDGHAVLDAANQLGLEGVVAKRASSTYASGKRSAAWRKIKLMNRDEFVVVGWTTGTGSREQTFGALLLAAYDGSDLRFVGSVGTGFDARTIDWFVEAMAGIEATADPCEVGPARPHARWVEPALVVEVSYSEWTRGPVLRHPSFSGLRPDRRAEEVQMPSSPHSNYID